MATIRFFAVIERQHQPAGWQQQRIRHVRLRRTGCPDRCRAVNRGRRNAVPRHGENDRGRSFHRQPGILGDFAFQLARPPSQRNPALSAFFRRVLRRRQPECPWKWSPKRVIHCQRRLPVAQRLMQNEAAIHLHRPTKEHRLSGLFLVVQFQLICLNRPLSVSLDRPVDDDAQRAVFAVTADDTSAIWQNTGRPYWAWRSEMIGQGLHFCIRSLLHNPVWRPNAVS